MIFKKHGEDGVDTYGIPAITTTTKGNLIAVYDVRRNSSSDLQGDIDIGMSRSVDGGQTWEPMKIIMDMDKWGGLPEDQNGVGDPSILVDNETGDIWVAALWAHGKQGKRMWTASGPGMKPEQTGQLMMVYSQDEGKNWSEPVNITPQVKRAEWFLLLQGPGKGITMHDGTLVFPAQFKDSTQMPFSTILWSKDHGKTWHIGTGAKPNTTEAQVIELDDGSLMLNMRDNDKGFRSVYITKDLGKTWIKHPTSRKSLIEPRCNASLIKGDFIIGGIKKSVVFFSNPNSSVARDSMTIKASLDDGMTWPQKYWLLIDPGRGRGYSSMTQINEKTIGILYEGSMADLVFQKVNIDDIIN